jgi:hypothetical protein
MWKVLRCKRWVIVVRVTTDSSNESGKLTKTVACISYTQRKGLKAP